MNLFDYDFQTKMYTVVTKSLAYKMPFVCTLRLKRFIQSIDWIPDDTLIHKWYNTLDEREKILITCDPVKDHDAEEDFALARKIS
ncbi:MAG TPA: hypothetical protein VF622_17505 [Segetibacter sp.]